jgi:CheY-like chemotaxis protein
MGARILVADDSVTIQKVVELTFSKEDVVLTQARNGEEAIRKAKETRPELVLLDLVMPDMNGYDVCAALRADPALRSVPIILLAGTFESFDHQRAAQAGANDFVTKPFESQVLIGKVKQLLFAKSMGAGSVGTAAKLAAGAATVRISPAAAEAPAVPPAPDAMPPAEQPASPAPPPVPSQEELWQLLGGPSDPTPAAAQPAEQADVSRGEVTAFGGPPAGPEGPLDLGGLDLELLPGEVPSAADAMEVLPLPESLSLDDLLATSPERPAAPLPGEPAKAEAAPLEPVFELSATAASPLPMVEAGKGEPPPLSVDDLLGPAGGDAAPADRLTMELPEFDLTALPEADAPAATDFESAQPVLPQVDTTVSELSLQGAGEAPMEAGVVETAGAAAPFEFLPPSQTGEEFSGRTEARASEPVAETLGAPAGELLAEFPTASTPAGLVADESVRGVPVGVSPSEMAAMREAVTERVARDLKRELGEKLLDRFEKIVWEVVPDLAELLITKEIERIRLLAEEEKSS